MVNSMKEINQYYKSYNESDEKINYIKYGILNEFGDNILSKNKQEYNEGKIIKKLCNIRKNNK